MQIKAPMRHHLTAVRIVLIKMFANNSEENVKKTTGSILSSNSTGRISGKDEKSNLKKKKYMYPTVHRSTIYNIQDVEAT